MKKKLLLAIAISIFLVHSLNAQVEKNDWLLGGTFSVNANNSNNTLNYPNSNTGISPHIAYAIGKNSVVGLNFNFNYNTASDSYHYLAFSTNILYKKYFVIKHKLGWYTQLGGGIGWSRSTLTTIDQSGQEEKIVRNGNLFSVGVAPGIYFQASPGILINADCGGLGYNYVYNTYGDGYWNSSFNVNFLSTFTFGIDFIIGKHRS